MAQKLRRAITGPLTIAAMIAVAACSSPEPAPPTPTQTIPVPDREIRVISALGDSVSRGVAACGELAPCQEVSWSTGDGATDSVANRLDDLLGETVIRHNNAAPGADAADLPRQAALAVEQQADLVTILIGSNDVCRTSVGAVTPVDRFRAHVSSALDILAEQEPQPYVYLFSVPNLVRVLEGQSSEPNAVQTWRETGACRVVLDALGGAQPDERLLGLAEQHIEDLNLALRDVCASHDNCTFDDGALYDYEFQSGDISDVDHFHPSAEGQQRLAELAWTVIAKDFGTK